MHSSKGLHIVALQKVLHVEAECVSVSVSDQAEEDSGEGQQIHTGDRAEGDAAEIAPLTYILSVVGGAPRAMCGALYSGGGVAMASIPGVYCANT